LEPFSAMLIAVTVDSSVHPQTVRAHRVRGRSLRLSASLSVRLVTVAYAVIFAAAGVIDYIGFRSAGYDLGNSVQISPFWTALPVARDVVTADRLVQADRHAVGLIPEGVPVSASNRLGASQPSTSRTASS
jgi:hypothetical protein